jgi:LPXTG-motif cell wall-anchored protein
MHRLSRRLAVGGVVVAALVACPLAANAASAVSAKVFAPDVSVAPGTSSDTYIPVFGAGQVHNLTLTFDASALPAHVSLDTSDSDDCEPAGSTVTCHLLDTDLDGVQTGMDITLKADGSAQPGNTGKLKVTVDSDETSPVTSTATIRVAEGVDLTAGPNIDVDTAPGKHVPAALTVKNSGTTTVHGAYLVMFGEDAFGFGTRYRNCVYVDALGEAYCQFDSDLAAGQTYGLSSRLDLAVAGDAQAPFIAGVDVSWMTPQDWADEKGRLVGIGAPQDGPHGTSPALTLVAVSTPNVETTPQTDVNPDDNHSDVTVHITGHNYGDFEAIGAKADGGAGATVTVKVGVLNHGPAAIRGSRSGNAAYNIDVTIPSGTTATAVPSACGPIVDGHLDVDNLGKPGFGEYGCSSRDTILAGQRILVQFTLHLDKALTNVKGKVVVSQPTDAVGLDNLWDNNTANNTADIVINPPGGVGGGNGGDNGSDGSLPVTGSNTPMIAGIGVLVLGVGVLLFWLGRRRRRPTTVA